MINTIMLDVDGVLANFRKGVHDAFGKSYDYRTLSEKWTFWDDWDDVTGDMVNSICDVLFWQHLPWMHDGNSILDAIYQKFNPLQIYLLTTPMNNVESPTGRWAWVRDNIPQFYKRTIITQAPKHLLARPDTLLIDDKDENVDGFREAGGKVLLVPRPWNRLHQQANRTSQYVREFLERIE